MPLHLLGKKSWNVYNQDNIERVRRDEERAHAAEKEAERRQRDDDATERLKSLRGDATIGTELEPAPPPSKKRRRDSAHEEGHNERAAQRPANGHRSRRDGLSTGDLSNPVSRDIKGNTSADPLDHISNIRLRDAAGRHADAQTPWYNSLSSPDNIKATGRDAWGNEDAGRQTRDQQRFTTNDPLLAMKRGVKQLREAEKQKSEWRLEREKDLNEVEELARRERHRNSRRSRRDEGTTHHRDIYRETDKDKDRNSRRHRRRGQSRSASPKRRRSTREEA